MTSLVISIALSFIPRFIKTFKEIYNNLRHIYKSRFRALVKAISATVSYSFESSVHTSESMKARGFLGGRRSVYTIYKITLKDVIYIVLTLVFLCISIYGYVGKHLTYIYYPRQMYEKDGAIRYALLVLFAVETLMISSTSGFVRKGKYETDRD